MLPNVFHMMAKKAYFTDIYLALWYKREEI